MKVYGVSTVEYGDTLCGVFTSERKAKDAIKVMKAHDDIDNIFTVEDWNEKFIIDEIELDKMYDIML